MKKRILIVEDDSRMLRILRDNLLFEGYEIECASDGRAALQRSREFFPDLVLLDVMLPGMDGFDVCSAIRKRGTTPILMLTARTQKTEKLRGLDLGADDYITKPFDLDELMARVRAVLRRARPNTELLSIGALRIDFVALTASLGARELNLTHREFDILKYLSERPGVVVHRDELLRELWGYQELPYTRSVDHAIGRLRKKIEPDLNHPKFIHTVRGDGYILTPDGCAEASGR